MEQKIHLAEPGHYFIYEGDAPKFRPPEKKTFIGNMDAINAFLINRELHISDSVVYQAHPNKSLVMVDSKEKAITLFVSPTDPAGMVIIAACKNDPELEKFNINTEQIFTRETLVKRLRYSAHLFANPDEHAKLLAGLQRFFVQLSGSAGAASDNRGNKSNEFEKQVRSSLPESFILQASVMLGADKQRFTVELCLDITDAGGAKFWLESPELEMLQQLFWQESVKTATAKAAEQCLTIIQN